MFTLYWVRDPEFISMVLANLGLDLELIRLVADLSPLRGETALTINTYITVNQSSLSVNLVF